MTTRPVVLAGAALLLCGTMPGCSSSPSPASNAPVTTVLTRGALPAPVLECFDGAATYASGVSAINNGGVVAGQLQADPAAGCGLHGYLWHGTGAAFYLLPLAPSPIPDRSVFAARLAVLSTNLVSGGISFIPTDDPRHPLEFATCNVGTVPSIVEGVSYVYGVSENGRYLTAGSPMGGAMLYDVVLREPYNLTIQGRPFELGMLVGVSNTGVVVGSWEPAGQTMATAVICSAASFTCEAIVGGDGDGFNAYLQPISSNGQHIYGFVESDDGTQLFSVNPLTRAVKPLAPGYIIGNLSPATDDGTIVITDQGPIASLLVRRQDGTHSIYSFAELADLLGLPDETSLRQPSLSPDGKWLAFDVDDFGPDDVFAVRVQFPGGITSWAVEWLTPVESIAGAAPILP